MFVNEGREQGWLTEQPDLPVSSYVTVNWLFQAYLTWCKDTEGIRQPMGRKTFSDVVGRRYPRQKSNGTRFTGLVSDAEQQQQAWLQGR